LLRLIRLRGLGRHGQIVEMSNLPAKRDGLLLDFRIHAQLVRLVHEVVYGPPGQDETMTR
jgi:hypothetical protein